MGGGPKGCVLLAMSKLCFQKTYVDTAKQHLIEESEPWETEPHLSQKAASRSDIGIPCSSSTRGKGVQGSAGACNTKTSILAKGVKGE
jgi:hypothetical protein